jgi:hypothetical protein
MGTDKVVRLLRAISGSVRFRPAREETKWLQAGGRWNRTSSSTAMEGGSDVVC